jgi:hypothetical protein
LVAAALLAVGCAAAPADPDQPPRVVVSRIDGDPAGIDARAGLRLLAAYELAAADPRFGGFSGFETDGRTLWLLSDRATLWQAAVELDDAGGTLRLSDWRVAGIVADAQDRGRLDSEALARSTTGDLLAAFEHDDSIRRLHRGGDGEWSTERLHDGRLLAQAPRNAGIEALAAWPDGRLVALGEGTRLRPGVALGVSLGPGGPETVGYALGDGFSPVGAASAGDDLYVLERAVGVLGGWRSRVTRSTAAAGGSTGVIAGETILTVTAGPLAENYEGIAVLEPPTGNRLILLISDDNQSALQRTLLLVLAEPD